MSLNVHLYCNKRNSGVFITENGKKRELTIEEVLEKIPNFRIEQECVFESNITHNLHKMATEAGIYEACWHPEKINAVFASDIIPLLEKGLKELKDKPEYYEQFNASNGWGTYRVFVPWIEEYLNACMEYPDAKIKVSI